MGSGYSIDNESMRGLSTYQKLRCVSAKLDGVIIRIGELEDRISQLEAEQRKDQSERDAAGIAANGKLSASMIGL